MEYLREISDLLIAAAYFWIPFTLLYFVRRRKDLPFNWMFICFGIFIVAMAAQVSARSFHPALYWLVIVATTTWTGASRQSRCSTVRVSPPTSSSS